MDNFKKYICSNCNHEIWILEKRVVCPVCSGKLTEIITPKESDEIPTFIYLGIEKI